MSTKPDGGPAFPLDASDTWDMQGGMSLRDYFAGQVIAATIKDTDWHKYDEYDVARIAYLVADAMLAERAK